MGVEERDPLEFTGEPQEIVERSAEEQVVSLWQSIVGVHLNAKGVQTFLARTEVEELARIPIDDLASVGREVQAQRPKSQMSPAAWLAAAEGLEPAEQVGRESGPQTWDIPKEFFDGVAVEVPASGALTKKNRWDLAEALRAERARGVRRKSKRMIGPRNRYGNIDWEKLEGEAEVVIQQHEHEIARSGRCLRCGSSLHTRREDCPEG